LAKKIVKISAVVLDPGHLTDLTDLNFRFFWTSVGQFLKFFENCCSCIVRVTKVPSVPNLGVLAKFFVCKWYGERMSKPVQKLEFAGSQKDFRPKICGIFWRSGGRREFGMDFFNAKLNGLSCYEAGFVIFCL